MLFILLLQVARCTSELNSHMRIHTGMCHGTLLSLISPSFCLDFIYYSYPVPTNSCTCYFRVRIEVVLFSWSDVSLLKWCFSPALHLWIMVLNLIRYNWWFFCAGEKPLVCKFPGCGKSYAHSSNLRWYYTQYYSPKLYPSWNILFLVRAHERTHSKTKPYQCHFAGCNKVLHWFLRLLMHLIPCFMRNSRLYQICI